MSFSSGLLPSVPLSEGEINKDACGTLALNGIHTWLVAVTHNINQPVEVKKWLRRNSEWMDCQESFLVDGVEHWVLTLEANLQ